MGCETAPARALPDRSGRCLYLGPASRGVPQAVAHRTVERCDPAPLGVCRRSSASRLPWRSRSRSCRGRGARSAAGTFLVGDQTIETATDSNPAGVAEAFQTTATASGSLATLTVYVDAGSTASRVVAGVYTNASGHPGALLTQGTLNAPIAGAWNDIPLTSVPIASGHDVLDRAARAEPARSSSATAAAARARRPRPHRRRASQPCRAHGRPGRRSRTVPSRRTAARRWRRCSSSARPRLAFAGSVGGANPPSQSLGISNGGTGVAPVERLAERRVASDRAGERHRPGHCDRLGRHHRPRRRLVLGERDRDGGRARRDRRRRWRCRCTVTAPDGQAPTAPGCAHGVAVREHRQPDLDRLARQRRGDHATTCTARRPRASRPPRATASARRRRRRSPTPASRRARTTTSSPPRTPRAT